MSQYVVGPIYGGDSRMVCPDLHAVETREKLSPPTLDLSVHLSKNQKDNIFKFYHTNKHSKSFVQHGMFIVVNELVSPSRLDIRFIAHLSFDNVFEFAYEYMPERNNR